MMESSRISRWSEDHAHKSSLEAAAEAAAKVNAMLIAKGKLKPSQLSQQQGNKPRSQAQQGGLIVAEVEINDVPIGCRNMLTRGATQEEISKLSGAAVSTRGRYLSPEEKVRNVGDRPLYLCVQGPNQESVDVAVGRINEIILNGMKSKGSRFNPQVRPPLPPVSMSIQRPPLNQPPPLMSLNTQPTGLAFVQEKLYIGLEHAPPTFDVKNKMLGPMGSYLNHIQTETGAKVTLRGKGSGFLEPTSGREAFEPMHVHLQHPTVMGLQQAKQLAENLIQTVQQEYAQFQQALVAMPPTLSPGTAQILAGLQQTAPALLNTQGIATLAAVSQPGLATLQPQPGGLPSFSSIGGFPGINPPQFTSVVMPTSTALTSMPPTFTLAPGSAPGIVVPTSLAPSGLPGSLAQVHVPTSLPVPISAASLLNPGSTLAGAPPQQVIVHTQGPPQLQTITQVGPPQLVQQPGSNPSSNSPVPQSMMTTVQPELQVVSQPGMVPAWGAPTVQQAPLLPPPQIIQMPNSSGPPPVSMVNNSCPLTMTTSTSGGYSYPIIPKEETKRRFTEEKQEEKVPENLLGYEHGPPHLTNLVVQGPPPGQNHSPSSLGQAPSQQQFHITQPPTITEGLPPPAVAPSISHSPPGQHNAPIYHVHTSMSEEGRVTHTYTVQANNSAGPGLQQPPLGLIEGRQGEPPDEDKKLMPPPPIPVGMKRPPSGDGGMDRKKMKEYGGDEEEEELQSSLRQQHKDVKKYQYNQYSNSPQLYGQQQAGAGDHAQIQPAQFGQGSPIPSPGPPQTFETQQPIPQQGQGHFAGQGQILYQQQQQQAQQGQPPPMEQFAQGPPLSVSPGLQQQQLLIQQQLPQQPGPPPPLHLQSPPPMSSQPISVNQNYQQSVYAASPQPSQSPPPPWNTEPVPSHSSASASPTPQFTSVTQPITMNSPQRLNPPEQRISQDEQPRLIGEQIPPPPPNFQNIPPPGSTPQLMTQPPPPPPPQHLLPFNTQPPQFAGQPPPPPPGQPGFQPTGPPVGLPYW